jgi:UDP-glucuronate 4-epimerase
MRVLVTGSAGFIGFHLARRLLELGDLVTGFDGMTPYYDVSLKRARHGVLAKSNNFTTRIGMLESEEELRQTIEAVQPDVIVHLAAQAGVRYGIENPKAYIDSNLTGSWRVLEAARLAKPKHLLIASSSSVYGANQKIPFEETDRADEPLSLYAATKKGMEAIAHAYSHLYEIPITVFRFFTVYGPWGRPDMALFKFTDAILHGRAVDVYGESCMQRDFTYIDDLVEAIIRLIPIPPQRNSGAPFRVVNIGGGQPVSLAAFIDILESSLGQKAIRRLLPAQPGDVPRTFASPLLLERLTGYRPQTPLAKGVQEFVTWYRNYYSIQG